ncbi:alkaline phosphatase family protein [bacterium]|nr:alkaline phosphatase family protein [bacterium]
MHDTPLDRRTFLKLVGAAAVGAPLLSACRRVPTGVDDQPRVLVLAFDALDPGLLRNLMRSGRLPNFARVAEQGGFRPLATSTPAQTPVAFGDIISGADSGTHQIYDFIHRDPRPAERHLAVKPFYAAAEAIPPDLDWAIAAGSWRLPLFGGVTRSLRRGPAFWESLIRHGIDTTIYHLPANYPPEPVDGPGRLRCLSGLGTPDLLGTHGLFTLYDSAAPVRGRTVAGGRFVRLSPLFHRAVARLIGPPNPLRRPGAAGAGTPLGLDFEIVRDPVNPVARIVIGGQTLLLRQGEWSDWVGVAFSTGLPGARLWGALGAPTSLPGMVRFYLKQVHPRFQLYVSPVNIDPVEPGARLTVPADWAATLAGRLGRFATLGIPEDTKALSAGAFTEEEFLEQADLALAESARRYTTALREFDGGCLVYYFGWPDLIQHMFWRDRDPLHPGHDPQQAEQFGRVIDDAYVRLDGLVGQALATLRRGDTLIILSDHGFTTFRRGFNLNTWLAANGYLQAFNATGTDADALFAGVDWTRTRAYGLGMTALYLNQFGREKNGVVRPPAASSLADEIAEKLLTIRDTNGAAVIRRIDKVVDRYPGADPALAPDLIIGYADGYRASWSTVLGGRSRELLEDNLDRWSGTHLVAPDLVPGILLSNRPIVVERPELRDIAPTILRAFDVPVPAGMKGQCLLRFP